MRTKEEIQRDIDRETRHLWIEVVAGLSVIGLTLWFAWGYLF